MKYLPLKVFALSLIAILGMYRASAQISSPSVLDEGYGYYYDVKLSDMDNDGLEDVIIVYREGYQGGLEGMYLYKSYIDGNKLKHKGEKISDATIIGLWILDYNGDGWNDIMVQKLSQGQVLLREMVVYLNNEGAFVKSEADLSFFIDGTRVISKVADMNADGYDDFLYVQDGDAHYNDTLKVAFNDNGDFSKKYTIAAEPGQFVLGDINGDDYADIVFEELLSGQPPVGTLYSIINVDGSTYEKTEIDSDFYPLKSILSISDLNNDGAAEIVISDSKEDIIYTYDGASNFVQLDTIIENSILVKMYDYDFDGDLDFHQQIQGDYYYHVNDGTGNYTINATEVGFIDGLHLGSYNSEDSLYGRHYFGDYELDIYYGNESLDIDRFRSNEFRYQSIDDVEIVDINQDGYEDIMIASRFIDLLGYFPGLPSGGFGDMEAISFDEGAKSFSVADFNQDGILDISLSGIWSGRNHILYGEGNGQFGEKVLMFDDLYLTRGEAVADFSQDGFPDIVMGDFNNETLYLRRNINGVFSDAESIATDFAHGKLHAKDVDQDGDADLIYRANSQLRWLENVEGEFTNEKVLVGALVSDYFFVDMDDDGIDEILTANQNYVYANKWNGTEYEVWISVLANETNSYAHFVPMDYNGDGFMDLIVKITNNLHRLYANVGNQSFEYDGTLEEKYGFNPDDLVALEDFVVDVSLDGDYDYLYIKYRNIMLLENLLGDESIRGTVYWDANLDSLKNLDELPIANAKITANNGSEEYVGYTDKYGIYKLFVESGEYTVAATPPNDCWESLAPDEIDLAYEESSAVNNVDFRMNNLGGEEPRFTASISRQPTRCGFTVRYFISLINDGCQTFDGKVSFTLDDKVINYSEISSEEYTLDGNIISIELEDFAPSQQFRFDLLVEVPGVEFIGEYLKDEISIEGVNGEIVHSQLFSSEIRCAYDPNDKLVSPDRTESYGDLYVLDETMTYTIRFQNTGNDTAFNVRLVDTLSNNLDLSTFRPIDASHDYNVLLSTDERVLEVFFNNILLPDSTVNYEGSNGFFSFNINPIADLTEFSEINNSAGIYFDFNPPIITNTVENVYVSDLAWVSTEELSEHTQITIFPNPSNGVLYIDSEQDILDIRAMDISGRSMPIEFKRGSNQITLLGSGVFLLSIVTEGQVSMHKVIVD